VSFLPWVALGGAVGAVLRFAALEAALSRGLDQFPWATLFVNLVGSAMLAFIAAWAAGPDAMWGRQPNLRMFVTVGLLGALTTYSTFNLEVLHLALAGRWRSAVLYFSLTAIGALVCGGLGMVAGRALHV
jgi:CrcB protein